MKQSDSEVGLKALKKESSLSDDFESGEITEQRLESFGYKEELRREFTYFSAFSFAVSVSGLFGTVGTTFIYPLEAGGSASVIWCWLISGVGCLCIAFSVAELVSAYPTSGGLYYACSRVFPKKWAPFMCWIDGWMNVFGQLAGVASSDYGAAQIILAAASIGTGGSYVPTTDHTVGVMAGVLAVQGAISCLPTQLIERFTKTYVIFHFAALIAGCAALLACTHNKHSGSYVFTNITDSSGWTPKGFSFLFGFLSVSWTMTDYDATAHICEEMEDPEKKAPWAISLAMIFTFVTGFLYNIVLCFCMGDPKALLSSSQPVVQIYYQSLGKAGAVAFAVFMFIIINFLGLTALQAASRTMWAQARDRMYPGVSPILYRVNHRTQTPINAVIVCTVFCIAVNLIALGSEQTIDAIFNVCAVALDWSYCLPILGKMMFPRLFKKGPWNLGAFSWVVNAWACIWTLFASIIFFMPTTMPVTKENMNYCVVFFVFVAGTSIFLWFTGGRRMYTGPKQTAEDKVEILDPQSSAEQTSIES